MALINFSNVSKMYETDLILDHATFQINKNEKVALLGANGEGKTTIFKLILKEIEPTLMPKEDKVGDISITKGTTIGYLSQDAIKNINQTVREELEEVFINDKKINDEFNEISLKLSEDPKNEDLLSKYDFYLEKLQSSRALTYQNEIETLISRFTFPLTILDETIKNLSGGERMKIAFIKLLLAKYNVLLLDEPTNHLDISTIEWLETYLKSYEGTIFFISHDRYFIESLSNKILELENKKVTTYNTNYENYLIEKENKYNNLLAQSQREEELMEKYRKFIDFYRYKPRFVGRAKDRMHKLARLEENHVVPPKKENHNIKINLEGGNLKNKQLLDVKNLLIGYDNKPLIPEVNFEVYGKDKIAIIGDNGVGKTTLIKSILDIIPKINGEVIQKRKLDIGYIKQNDYTYKKGEDILSHLKNIYPLKSEKELRGALGRFLFKKEEVFKDCSLLSNGEKMRVNLCALMLSSYDILILDEPTNHLDMVTKECLIEGLKSYNGAILVISHDRYFINEVADFILYLSKEKNIFFEGNYDDFKLKYDESNIVQEIKKEDKKEELVFDELPKEKEKLSKNAISQINSRIAEIEESLENLDLLINEELDYKKIDEYVKEKEELEIEYFDLLNKLDGHN